MNTMLLEKDEFFLEKDDFESIVQKLQSNQDEFSKTFYLSDLIRGYEDYIGYDPYEEDELENSSDDEIEEDELENSDEIESDEDELENSSDEPVYYLHDVVKKAFEIYPDIEELMLDYVDEDYLDDNFFRIIAPHCTKIKAISFDNITLDSIGYLAEHCKENLKELYGGANFCPSENEFIAFINTFPLLKSIHIETSFEAVGYQIPDNVMLIIAENCTDLEECVFPIQNKITDETMAKLIRNSRKLRKLDISGCEQVGYETLAAIVESPVLESLGCASFTKDQLATLSQKKNLLEIDIRYLELHYDEITGFVKEQSKLKKIIVSDDHGEGGLHYRLLSVLPGLEVLKMNDETLNVNQLRESIACANMIRKKEERRMLDMTAVKVFSFNEIFDETNIIQMSEVVLDSEGKISDDTMLDLVILKLYQQSAYDITVCYGSAIVGGSHSNFNIKYPIIQNYLRQLIDTGVVDIHGLNSMHENAATVALRQHIMHCADRYCPDGDRPLSSLLPYVTIDSEFYGTAYEDESNSLLRMNRYLLLSNFLCSIKGYLNCKSDLLLLAIRKANCTQTVEWIIE